MFYALHDHQSAEAITPTHNIIDYRHHRRAAETTGDDHDVATLGQVQRPTATVGTANAEAIAGLELCQALGYTTDTADGVIEQVYILRIGDDRNRHFTDAVQVKHVELPRRKAVGRVLFRVGDAQAQREDSGRLLDTLHDFGLEWQMRATH